MSEPEPNLNLENGAQVNRTKPEPLKYFLAGTKPEPEPLFETVRHPGFDSLRRRQRTEVEEPQSVRTLLRARTYKNLRILNDTDVRQTKTLQHIT